MRGKNKYFLKFMEMQMQGIKTTAEYLPLNFFYSLFHMNIKTLIAIHPYTCITTLEISKR